MEQYRRIFWISVAAAIPTGSMSCALVLQVHKVRVATQNAEAELLLDRQARLKRQMEEALAAGESPSGGPESASSPGAESGPPAAPGQGG